MTFTPVKASFGSRVVEQFFFGGLEPVKEEEEKGANAQHLNHSNLNG